MGIIKSNFRRSDLLVRELYCRIAYVTNLGSGRSCERTENLISGAMLDETKRKDWGEHSSNMAQEIEFATFPARSRIFCLHTRLPATQANM